jgi:DNA-binding transcriptional regulator YbjK
VIKRVVWQQKPSRKIPQHAELPLHTTAYYIKEAADGLYGVSVEAFGNRLKQHISRLKIEEGILLREYL